MIKKLLITVAIVAGAAGLTGCGSNDRFNAWINGCIAEGGHVSLTHKGESEDWYECFRDDEIIQVPGDWD